MFRPVSNIYLRVNLADDPVSRAGGAAWRTHGRVTNSIGKSYVEEFGTDQEEHGEGGSGGG